MSDGKAWYQYKRVWIIGLLVPIVCLRVWEIYYQFYRPIEVTRGPWQVLDPGQPVDDPLKFEVAQEGAGAVVEPGDLVMISLQRWSSDREKTGDQGEWWIWTGFRTKNETAFHSINPRLVSVFVGQKEGGKLRIATNSREDLHLNPFGSDSSYRSGKGTWSKWTSIGSTNDVYIKKVFKGQLKYRTTHLYDGTWIHFCGSWFNCKYVNTPREAWVDDARFDGVSNDGKRATFQYGPLKTRGKKWNGPGSTAINDYQRWIQDEWNKLPVGVQVK